MADTEVENGDDSGELAQESEDKTADVDNGSSDEDSSAKAAERRKAYRLNKVLGATMTSTEGDSTKTRLFIIDISISGFRATDHRPPAEEECDISIVLVKDQEPFVSRMRVVWVKELTVSGMYQMGCEFLEPPEAELAKLESFIEQSKSLSSQTKKAPIKIDNPWTMI